jgi:hypothetical protein
LQGGYSCIHFTNVLWPDFSFLDFAKCVVHFQLSHAQLVEMSTAHTAEVDRENRLADIVAAGYTINDRHVNEGKVAMCATERDCRVDTFIRDIHTKRDLYFQRLAAL